MSAARVTTRPLIDIFDVDARCTTIQRCDRAALFTSLPV